MGPFPNNKNASIKEYRASMTLLIQPATSPNPKRQAEYSRCLRENPRWFASTVILPPEPRMTFRQMFLAANRIAGVVVVANADILFNETIRLGEQVKEREVFALSRWDGGKVFDEPYSQDVWIVRTPVPEIPADFTMGMPGCDSRLAQIFHELGYVVRNPALSIRCDHIHDSGVHSYTKGMQLPGRYRPVPIEGI